MKKRLLSGLLAAVLVLGLAPAALAAAPAEDEAAQVLAALDIMVGDSDGNLELGRAVTRAEFTKMAVAASTSRDAVGDTVPVKPYPDVPQTYWAAPWIKAAVDLGLVQGDLRGYFNPTQTITLAEGVTIVLRLLGYPDSAFTGVWPSGQMAQYKALKLNEGVSCAANDAMTRRDALYLFYNLLITKNTSGVYHLNVLEPARNLVSQTGTLDRVALVNSAMEGPVVAGSGWQSQVPFDVSGARVYRSGSLSALSAIRDQDVVYWSKSMRTVWAYTNQVTGTYQAASPSASAPTAVTVAGKSYAIETASAAFALSDLGEYRVGDTITLLLGRDGGVAAVSGGAPEGTLLYCVVTAIADAAYDDGAGGAYTARTATVCATDGTAYRYPFDRNDLKVGDLVRVNAVQDGFALNRLTAVKLTGKVSNDGKRLGSYEFADDVEILDTYENCTPIRVYPDRLAGSSLTGSTVRFYVLNAQGEISHLILKDATGDLHQYGVITSVTEVSMGLNTASNYVYDVGGMPQAFSSETTVFNLKVGPCQAKMKGPQSVERLYNLTPVDVETVDGGAVLGTDGKQYTLSETAVYYVRTGSAEYQLSSLARVQAGDYDLTAWYDKPENEGGRIRVIIAD